MSPAVKVRKRTIEDDDGHADSTPHGMTAWRMPCRTAYYSNGNDVRTRATPGGRRETGSAMRMTWMTWIAEATLAAAWEKKAVA
jgi:hypothetical protein